MTTRFQADAVPDPSTIHTPILLKVPIALQPLVLSPPYGCEVVVPIRLNIPIALEVELISKPSSCQPHPPARTDRFTASVSHSTAAAAPELSATLSDSTSEAIAALAPTPEPPQGLQTDPALTLQPLSQSDPNPAFMQERGGKKPRLHSGFQRCYPITVLTLLLGILLGVGGSVMAVKYLLSLDAHPPSIIGRMK
jgi:hypothetical protein